jgi:hypothetical protein
VRSQVLTSNLPPPNSATISARQTIHTVYSKLVQSLTSHDAPRLITLVGPSGIGKSQIALFALRYLRERNVRFNLGFVAAANLLGHIGGGSGRRKHRSLETFHGLIADAIRGRGVVEREGDGGGLQNLLKAITQPSVLLLDGCDVWMCATAFRFNQAVSSLIQTCPNLIILATARNGLMEKIVSTPQTYAHLILSTACEAKPRPPPSPGLPHR